MPVLHVIVPCYNEPQTLRPCIDRIRSAHLPDGWEALICLVDDCSEPTTAKIADELAAEDERITLIRHQQNRGKGAAIQTACHAVIEHAAPNDLAIIQDADLEYNPDDFALLIDAIQEHDADAVFGDRFANGTLPSPMGFLHTKVNRGLTHISNWLTGLRVADMECCYKLIRIPMLIRILPELRENRFGIEPQIAAALGRANAQIENVVVSYAPRGFDEGKKIGLSDGLRALYIVFHERLRGGTR